MALPVRRTSSARIDTHSPEIELGRASRIFQIQIKEDPAQRGPFFARLRPAMELTPERIVRDGAAYLGYLGEIASPPFAITGYCLGGRLGWWIAAAYPERVAALAAFQPGVGERRRGALVATMNLPDPGPPNIEFERPADRAHLERTAAALGARGFKARVVNGTERARQLVLEAIPQGSEVHSALSETMRALGITSEIDEPGAPMLGVATTLSAGAGRYSSVVG